MIIWPKIQQRKEEKWKSYKLKQLQHCGTLKSNIDSSHKNI
jgi:hypothetical protein